MSQHKEIENGLQDMQAASLLTLVKEHKKSCDGKCNISLFLLYPIYKKLVGEGAIQDMQHFI